MMREMPSFTWEAPKLTRRPSFLLLDLPQELQLHTMSFCDLRDLSTLKRICKALEAPASDFSLEVSLFAKQFFTFKKTVESSFRTIDPRQIDSRKKQIDSTNKAIKVWSEALDKLQKRSDLKFQENQPENVSRKSIFEKITLSIEVIKHLSECQTMQCEISEGFYKNPQQLRKLLLEFLRK